MGDGGNFTATVRPLSMGLSTKALTSRAAGEGAPPFLCRTQMMGGCLALSSGGVLPQPAHPRLEISGQGKSRQSLIFSGEEDFFFYRED